MGDPQEFVEFEDSGLSATGKTRIWTVLGPAGKLDWLGEVRWFGRWRCYAFFPIAGTVYEQKCLYRIATFCEDRTREHKAAALARAREIHPTGYARKKDWLREVDSSDG